MTTYEDTSGPSEPVDDVSDFLDDVDDLGDALTQSDTGRALAAYQAIGDGLANISARLRTSRTSKAVVVDLAVLRAKHGGRR
jgi:hypothetical protein